MFHALVEERRRASIAFTRSSSVADTLEDDGRVANVRTMGTAELTQFLVHTLVQRNAGHGSTAGHEPPASDTRPYVKVPHPACLSSDCALTSL